MSNKYEEPIYVCPECGSEDVMEPTWVYANKEDFMTITGDRVADVDFDLCGNCDAQMEIITQEQYNKNRG